MSVLSASTRRDRRYPIRSGIARVEFADGATPGALTTMSVAGLAFIVPNEDAHAYAVGSTIDDVTVRVGECVLRGGLVVRDLRDIDGGVQIGCLFHPRDEETEGRVMALVAGLRASGVA